MLGDDLRDEGMASVAANNPGLTKLVVKVARELPIGWEGMFEEVRRTCEKRGIIPTRPEFWGSATTACIRAGVLVDTGRRAKPVDASSHSCKKSVYRRTDDFEDLM